MHGANDWIRSVAIMKTWVTIFLALVSIHSALAASKLEVVYQDRKISLDQADLAKLPAQEVEASDHQTKHRYAGVLVRDILGLVGAPLGDSLRGKALTLVVRITGNDNYSVVFALAEFDPGFSDRAIILSNQQDSQPLPDNAAPFRVVIPGDTHPARWVRQVKSIEVVPLAP
jgi:DMSO/TMAO reductase YedYZ molybdopterin-dependent catalytic subunit